PYRVIVSGRIKHFISAFGEHIIGKEVEQAMKEATENSAIRINEFTVAPQINPDSGLPYHEWFVEFENEPENLSDLAQKLDVSLQKQNSYYLDLIEGKVLQPLKISKIEKNGFQQYMKSLGKLGGQNKIARLSNDRKIADALKPYTLLK
ncbi:MAG: GH3 auxin-responsive promoter family protein, partial [Olleya sp.]